MTSCRSVDQIQERSITYKTTQQDAQTAASLGLGDFTLVFDLNNDDPRFTIWTVNFLNGQSDGNPKVVLDVSGNLLSVTGSSYGAGVTPIYGRRIPGSSTDFTLSTTNPVSATVGVTWYLSVDSSQIVPRADCPLTVNPLKNLTSFFYSTPELDIVIKAESSADGLQLTLATITITQNGVSSTCTFYNLDLPSVMCGPGCTLFSKAQGNPLLSVVEYSLLKFALTNVLYGCYWLGYLTQLYNSDIMSKLRQQYPYYYNILLSLEGYELLFCETPCR